MSGWACRAAAWGKVITAMALMAAGLGLTTGPAGHLAGQSVIAGVNVVALVALVYYLHSSGRAAAPRATPSPFRARAPSGCGW